MGKKLILIRHAKSSWNDANLDDIDRPLNERGKRDAPAMAHKLSKAGISPDLLLSSTAKRAKATAEFFAREFDHAKKEIVLDPSLYLAGISDFQHAVKSLDDKYETVAIFSHNPGITEFASSLTPIRVDDLPTCSIFAVKSSVDQWKEFFSTTAEFWFFDSPKAGSVGL